MSVERVLRRKLAFLGYPSVDTFSLHSADDISRLLIWLEDRVIRCLPTDARQRDIESEAWTDYVESYLTKLNCPYRFAEAQCMVDWLLNFAVEIQPDGYTSTESANKPIGNDEPNDMDIFANIDEAESSEFKEGVAKLSKLLSIPHHVDPKQSFRAICILVEKMLSDDAIKRAIAESDKKIELLETDDIFLGFEVTDPLVRDAAVALRLLHVSELRNLQDLINHAIVQVQQLTADPKTDEKLGHVGF